MKSRELGRGAGVAGFLIVIFLTTGCGHFKRRARRPPPPVSPVVVQGEEGIASWYGHPYHGRRAAGGEIYNMYDLTAAHRTLPFGTNVRVHNLENPGNVVVRINDRGPFVEGRIIDLSYAAARAIHISGIARVRLEILNLPPGSSLARGQFSVQVGAFIERANAERLKLGLEKRYSPVFIQRFDRGDEIFYRVRVGRVTLEAQAEDLARQLRSENVVPFVVRLD